MSAASLESTSLILISVSFLVLFVRARMSHACRFYVKLKIFASLIVGFQIDIQRPIQDLIVHLELSVTFMGINQIPRAIKRRSGKSQCPVLGCRGPGCKRSQTGTTSSSADLGTHILCTTSVLDQDGLSSSLNKHSPLSLFENLPPPEDEQLTRNPNGKDIRLELQICLI